MATVPEQLKQAREKRKLTVTQVADITKIKSEHVRALEEGRYKAFAAPVYIRGFVRTYASLLQLDGPAILKELEAELANEKQFKDAGSLMGRRRTLLDFIMLQLSRINWKIALPLLAIATIVCVVVFGYRAWVNYRSEDPLSKLGPGVHQSSLTNVGELLPLPSPTAATPAPPR